MNSDSSDISDEDFDICRRPRVENDRISEEEDIYDNILSHVALSDVCFYVRILTKRLPVSRSDAEEKLQIYFGTRNERIEKQFKTLEYSHKICEKVIIVFI
ncbi:hypothetical protein AVEN_251233-1 [Araneus ventricosus]|uniref:Uncharacterized protein n=1 Tax=Araneus ventricosus TaxID=182803 RepID=A0A4Y2RDY1_ARAVE|nr:hypothetical protein AVEN_251233-1 [Araneus ventricosus]